MTVRAAERLQNFFERDSAKPQVLGTSTSTREVVTKAQPTPVMVNGVDALSITWMILTQALWLKLRFKTTTRQLARWCDGFIRWLPGSSVRIGRVEPRRKTSAK